MPNVKCGEEGPTGGANFRCVRCLWLWGLYLNRSLVPAQISGQLVRAPYYHEGVASNSLGSCNVGVPLDRHDSVM